MLRVRCCSAAIVLQGAHRLSSAAGTPGVCREIHMDPQTVVIKKYGNRRLYDSTHSRYVNLDEVAQMVRDGRDVQVRRRDHRRGSHPRRADPDRGRTGQGRRFGLPARRAAPDGRRLRQGHERGRAHLHAGRLRHVPERLPGRVARRGAACRAADAATRAVSGRRTEATSRSMR